MPHFLGCDEEVLKGVIGLNPDREEHESYVDVEPVSDWFKLDIISLNLAIN